MNGITGGVGNLQNMQNLGGINANSLENNPIFQQIKQLVEKMLQGGGENAQGAQSPQEAQKSGGCCGDKGEGDQMADMKKLLGLIMQNPEIAAQVPGIAQLLGGQNAGQGALGAGTGVN